MTDPRCWNDLEAENAALRAENARLREIVAEFDHLLAVESVPVRKRFADTRTKSRAALAHGIAHDQAPYDPEK